MVAEADEKLMEKFFEAGTLTDEELVAGLRSATAAAKVFPLVCTSALANIGVPQLLDAIVSYLPSPADRPYTGVDKDGADVACAADEKKPPQAFVWKTIADPFAGRITMFRVVTGHAQGRLDRPQQDARHRRSGSATSLLLQGKTQTNVPEIKAGDLGAVAKLKDTLTNDTLGDKASPADVSGHHVPRAGALVRDRAEDARRRRQDQHVDAPARGRGSVDQVQPRSADQGTAAVGPGPAAHRGRRSRS